MYYLVMKIPIAEYDIFMEKVDPTSRAYVLLKDGVFEREEKGGRFQRHMKLLCEKEEAAMLLKLAERLCPEIIRLISRDWAE